MPTSSHGQPILEDHPNSHPNDQTMVIHLRTLGNGLTALKMPFLDNEDTK